MYYSFIMKDVEQKIREQTHQLKSLSTPVGVATDRFYANVDVCVLKLFHLAKRLCLNIISP